MKILLLAYILITFPAWVANSQNIYHRNILILHSFHKGHVWNDSISDGVESFLNDHRIPSTNLHLFYEYMDVERINDPEHTQNLFSYFRKKYAEYNFDLIIASDDPAFNFLFKYQQTLFPATPVVFCGVNYFDEFDMFGHELFTGVLENIDILKTVNIALQLHPETKKILVIVDNSETSIATIKTFVKNFKYFDNPAMFNFITFQSIEKIQQKLSRLPSDTLVFYVNFIVDSAGNRFSAQESIKLMVKNCQSPVYSFWDSYLGNGIVGGLMASGSEQGKKAAQIALRILKGEDVRNIPVDKESPNKYMFDHKQLRRFHIKSDTLPENSEIINIPFSFYAEYKRLVWGVVASIIGLALTIFVLLLNIFKRKQVEISLKRFSKQLKILHEIDRAILEENFSEKAVSNVLQYVRTLYASFRASLFIFNFKKKTATVMAVDADKESSLSQGAVFPIDLFNAEALRDGKPLWIDDLKSSGKFSIVEDLLKEKGISGYMSIPLISGGGLIGSLNLSGFTPDQLHSEETDIIEDLATSLAVAIRNMQLLKKIRRHERELEKLSAKVIEAQELTYRKISFELHDEIGQALTGVIINLSTIEKILAPDSNQKIKTLLADSKDTIDRLSEQTHDLSLNLWPPMLRDFGLETTLGWYLERIGEKVDIEVNFNMSDTMERLTEEFETTIYRLVQEATTNVLKHAEASRLNVSLSRKSHDMISVIVQDNGKGFQMDEFVDNDKIKDRLGLLNMRERVAFLGGRLNILAHPGAGVRITADIPWKQGDTD